MRSHLLIFAAFISFGCYSQSTHEQSKSMTMVKASDAQETLTTENLVQNYGLDYELANYSFPPGDSSILNQLNLPTLFQHRDESKDKEFIDLEHGVTIIMYSRQKSIEKRQESIATPN